MANHKSSVKRIRQTKTRDERNHYHARTARNVIKKIRISKDASEVEKMLPEVTSMLDKLAKTNIIHRNKAANLKSSLAKHANVLKK